MFGRTLAGALLSLLLLATTTARSAEEEKPEPGLNGRQCLVRGGRQRWGLENGQRGHYLEPDLR